MTNGHFATRIFVIVVCILGIELPLLASCSPRQVLPTSPISVTIPPVPKEYQPLYTELSDELVHFEGIISQNWDDSLGQTVFATELAFANGNIGEGLLLPETMEKNRLLLDQLQKMGIKGVVLSIKFPLLEPTFPRSAEYLNFYKEVIAEARRHSLKVLVETGAIFAGTAFSPVEVDWSKYTSETFLQGMQDQLVLIANEIKPDYLTLTEEPDTQAALTKLHFANSDWTAFVDTLLKRIDHSSGMLVGAGMGSWGDQTLTTAFISMPGLDYIDLHIYPPGKDAVFLERALSIAQQARSAGKRVTIGECWLYKTLPEDLGGGPGIEGDVFNNDAFSFWYPLDARFIHDIMDLADATEMDFASFFWMRNFFAYLDYNQTPSNLSTATINRLINQDFQENVQTGNLSLLGQYVQTQLNERTIER